MGDGFFYALMYSLFHQWNIYISIDIHIHNTQHIVALVLSIIRIHNDQWYFTRIKEELKYILKETWDKRV